MNPLNLPEGILLINKPRGSTSFSLVSKLRKILNVKKIGHAGTLDPFATGVMVMLIGKNYTRLSDQFLGQDKEYRARLYLGMATDTYDCEGTIQSQSSLCPSLADLEKVLKHFQGWIDQIPPMYSAKKIKGQKLYDLARQGKEVERSPVKVHVHIQLESYNYPYIDVSVKCSKGTYIRSLAHDIGQQLGCGAHLVELQRLRSGSFHINECMDGSSLDFQSIINKLIIIK